MDRRTRRLIDEAVAGFTSHTDGRIYVDGTAAAVYRLEPPGSECVALACLKCQTVTIRPGAPRLPQLTMACSQCAELWLLTPPAEVLAFGATGIRIVGVDAPTVRLT